MIIKILVVVLADSMLYEGMDPQDREKVGDTWLRGHSDSGGFTFITSQPIFHYKLRLFHW